MTSRRDFLSTLGALAGSLAASGSQPLRALVPRSRAAGEWLNPGRLERIGIQLYTVRRAMQENLERTLGQVAEIGYKEVEFAGYFGRTAAQVRSALAQAQLASPSTHIGYDLISSSWDRALDEAAAIGHQYVTIPWLPAEARATLDSWRQVAERLNQAGERAKKRGLRLAYHNHDFEFTRVGGQLPYDILLAETDPGLVEFQMDIFWLVKGGGDPREYLRKHPSRFTMLHIKDSSGPPEHRQVDVGAGVIDFAAILRLDREQGSAVKHVFVEHDEPSDPMAFARRSFQYLNAMEI